VDCFRDALGNVAAVVVGAIAAVTGSSRNTAFVTEHTATPSQRDGASGTSDSQQVSSGQFSCHRSF
jgi:hypothetical protein